MSYQEGAQYLSPNQQDPCSSQRDNEATDAQGNQVESGDADTFVHGGSSPVTLGSGSGRIARKDDPDEKNGKTEGQGDEPGVPPLTGLEIDSNIALKNLKTNGYLKDPGQADKKEIARFLQDMQKFLAKSKDQQGMEDLREAIPRLQALGLLAADFPVPPPLLQKEEKKDQKDAGKDGENKQDKLDDKAKGELLQMGIKDPGRIENLREGVRPAVEEMIAKVMDMYDNGPAAGCVLSTLKNKIYSQSGLEFTSDGRPLKKESVKDSLLGGLNDLIEGLLGGIVAAGIDWVRFNQEDGRLNADTYRFEQIGTQVLVGRALAEQSTGAALAFAAFQWCFTNDVLFYVWGSMIGDEKQKADCNKYLRGETPTTWATWSFLGVLKHEGSAENPMSWADVKKQAFIIGPVMAYVLAVASRMTGLKNLIGNVLDVSFSTKELAGLDQTTEGEDLKVQLNVGLPANLVAEILPHIQSSGAVDGETFKGTINIDQKLGDLLLRMDAGCQVDRGPVEKEKGELPPNATQGNTNLTQFSVPIDLALKGKNFTIICDVKIPVGQTGTEHTKYQVTDKDGKPVEWNVDQNLTKDQVNKRFGDRQSTDIMLGGEYHDDHLTVGSELWLAIHPSHTSDMEMLWAQYQSGKFSAYCKLINSFSGKKFRVSTGVEYQTENLDVNAKFSDIGTKNAMFDCSIKIRERLGPVLINASGGYQKLLGVVKKGSNFYFNVGASLSP